MTEQAREVFVYQDDFKFPTTGNFMPTVKPANAPDFDQDAPDLDGSIPQDESELGGDQGKGSEPVELQPVDLGTSPDLAGTAKTGTKPPENS